MAPILEAVNGYFNIQYKEENENPEQDTPTIQIHENGMQAS